MTPKNLIIFASGTAIDGGTGAENLIQQLPGRTLAVVSTHENGGVRRRAEALSVSFFHFAGPYSAKGYRELIEGICTEIKVNERDLWYALSGWFKMVSWLDSARTFNIHPAPLPRFAGMYGEKLHQAVWESYRRGEITEGEIVMQFVTPESPAYDDGPIFFRYAFSLSDVRSYEDYRERVRNFEHHFQPIQTALVIQGKISWDGVHFKSLKVPADYSYL